MQDPGRKAQKPTQTAASAADSAQKKLQKCGAPLVEQRKICYTVLHDAPSPSGKAGDFDSPIVGSTPAGATEKEPAGGLGDRFPAGFIFCEKRVFV